MSKPPGALTREVIEEWKVEMNVKRRARGEPIIGDVVPENERLYRSCSYCYNCGRLLSYAKDARLSNYCGPKCEIELSEITD